jgi:hypothetical protein
MLPLYDAEQPALGPPATLPPGFEANRKPRVFAHRDVCKRRVSKDGLIADAGAPLFGNARVCLREGTLIQPSNELRKIAGPVALMAIAP